MWGTPAGGASTSPPRCVRQAPRRPGIRMTQRRIVGQGCHGFICDWHHPRRAWQGWRWLDMIDHELRSPRSFSPPTPGVRFCCWVWPTDTQTRRSLDSIRWKRSINCCLAQAISLVPAPRRSGHHPYRRPNFWASAAKQASAFHSCWPSRLTAAGGGCEDSGSGR